MSEKQTDIPQGWEWTKISDIGQVVSGGTPSTKVPEYWGEDVNWISPSDLTGYKAKTIKKGAKNLTQQGYDSSSAKLMPAGSVHFSSRAPIGYVVISAEPLCTNQGFKSLVPAEGVFNEYVYYYLISAKNIAEQVATGTTFKEISGKAFGNLPIPLPPLNEQRRIVAKLEALFSQLEAGTERLRTARAQLKTYRQAILKHAFEGKLTADWRTQNATTLEPAEILLKRIQHEREAHYQQQLKSWHSAVQSWEATGKTGKKPSKPRKQKIDPPSPEQQQKKWDIPDSWQWLQIGDFAFVTKLAGFEYTDYVKYDEDGDLPVIKAENAGPNGFRRTDYSKVKSETVSHLTRSHLNGGELLVVFVGAGTGNVATVPTHQSFFLGPNIGMVRPESDSIETKYIELFLRSVMGKSMILASMKAVAQPSISMGTIRQTPIAIPSYEEQLEVVKLLDEKFSLIDDLERTIDTELHKAESLRQSILKAAFAGKLIPQHPADEPASALLARIQKQKATQTKTKKRTKRSAA